MVIKPIISSIFTLLCLLALATEALSQINTAVTPTVWSVEIKNISAVVSVTVPAVDKGARDYVSVVPPNAPLDDFTNWQYVSAAVKGVLTFKLKPGVYQARYYKLAAKPASAPGKLVDTESVSVPVPLPRPIEINSPGVVDVTHRATDTNGDVSIRFLEDQSRATVTADKSENIKVNKVVSP